MPARILPYILAYSSESVCWCVIQKSSSVSVLVSVTRRACWARSVGLEERREDRVTASASGSRSVKDVDSMDLFFGGAVLPLVVEDDKSLCGRFLDDDDPFVLEATLDNRPVISRRMRSNSDLDRNSNVTCPFFFFFFLVAVASIMVASLLSADVVVGCNISLSKHLGCDIGLT